MTSAADDTDYVPDNSIYAFSNCLSNLIAECWSRIIFYLTMLLKYNIHNGKNTSEKIQPPALIAWGKNDSIFPAEAAHPYKRDLKK
jgi:pimeloyl-ACP methyl ester carboxylesterase